MTAKLPDARLKWQCRRGMRELDELLTDYLERRFAHAAGTEQQAFRELLALPDALLIDYLLRGREATDPDLAHVIRQVCLRTQAL